MTDPQASTHPQLTPSGLLLGDQELPLYAGSIHYWRLDPANWKAALQAISRLGFGLVDLYIPWSVHEQADGSFDFGKLFENLDVARFLKLADDVGLKAIVRPGPHINAELTHFGIPKHIVWNKACQAHTPRGRAVMLPMLPVAFPVPSYASEAFQREVLRYFEALGPVLEPLVYPKGPIVMVQVDNEGALYFRDSPYDQDYHPDAVSKYREFLKERYGSQEALDAAYGEKTAALDHIKPPTKFDAVERDDVLRHVDWVVFHEQLLAASLGSFADTLRDVGLKGLPTVHNLPMGQEATPLNPARIGKEIDLVALDYYGRATPQDAATIARRTSELATRSAGGGVPTYAAEMGAGFPPFFPPISEDDSLFTLLCALAYGLRGFNLYMAVDRDRWIGAPIDTEGKERPLAERYRKLLAVLKKLRFHELQREVPVRLLTPRSLRRLTRMMHGFGPLTGALFSVLGAGANERCLEDDFGLGGPVAIEGDEFLRGFEQSLAAQGIPYGHIGGEDIELSLKGAKWVICASAAGLAPKVITALADVGKGGAAVTFGPRLPTVDGGLRDYEAAPDFGLFENPGELPLEVSSAAPAQTRAISAALGALDLPTYVCDERQVQVTVHHDKSGTPRALFLINPTTQEFAVKAPAVGAARGHDLLAERVYTSSDDRFSLAVAPKSVTLLALE